LPSTNTYLRERARGDSAAPAGTVVASREQTAGRGRFDRHWISAPGRDLAFSFLIHARSPRARLPSLAIASALGVAEALEAFALKPVLKWPNDVLVGGRKICGILPESVSLSQEGYHAVVIGIGMNVNMDAETAGRIPKPATSILMETGRTTPIESLLKGLLECLEPWIDRWEAGGFAALREAWEKKATPSGTPMVIEERGRRFEGIVEGYGDNGELRLRDAGGRIHTFGSGDAVVVGSTR